MPLTTIDGDVRVTGQLSAKTMAVPQGTVTDDDFSSSLTDALSSNKQVHRVPYYYHQVNRQTKHRAKSRIFNIDNGAGTTIDDVIMIPSVACTITQIRIVYTTETTGTVAGASVQLGTSVGGTDIAAATNYENSKAVGTTTSVTIADGAIAAAEAVHVRHTGIAATAAGEAIIQIEYTIDSENEVVSATVPIAIGRYDNSVIQGVEVMCLTAPTGGDKAFTVDLKKGSQSEAFATVLSGTISYSSTQADKEIEIGTISDSDLDDGEELQLVIATSGTTGSQGKDLIVVVHIDEQPTS